MWLQGLSPQTQTQLLSCSLLPCGLPDDTRSSRIGPAPLPEELLLGRGSGWQELGLGPETTLAEGSSPSSWPRADQQSGAHTQPVARPGRWEGRWTEPCRV